MGLSPNCSQIHNSTPLPTVIWLHAEVQKIKKFIESQSICLNRKKTMVYKVDRIFGCNSLDDEVEFIDDTSCWLKAEVQKIKKISTAIIEDNMVCKDDRIFGCNSFDGEVKFIFATLKEIVDENLQKPIKKVLKIGTQPDMMADGKKAESERKANLQAWKEKRAAQKRGRQFQLEQIRNARSGDHQGDVNDTNERPEDREASDNHQRHVNDINGEILNPPLCENDRDREMLKAKGRSSNTNAGGPESALAPGQCRGKSPERTQSTKSMGCSNGNDGGRDMSVHPTNGHDQGHSQRETLLSPSKDIDDPQRNYYTTSIPDGGTYDVSLYLDDEVPEIGIQTRDSFEIIDVSHWQKSGRKTAAIDDEVPESGIQSRDSFEVIDVSHWQKAGRKTDARSWNAIDDASFWTEVRTNRKDLPDASAWSDVLSMKTTATRTSIKEVDRQFENELRVVTGSVCSVTSEKCIKGRRGNDSIGKVDTTFWEEKSRGKIGGAFRDAALQEIDRRAWHIF